MSSVRRKLRSSVRLKTLRGSVAPSYTSLQSELVMLLHQKDRLEQEERILSSRLGEVRHMLVQLAQAADGIRERALELEGRAERRPEQKKVSAAEPQDEAARIRERGRGMRLKQMSVHY
jgi:hypothetical protein